MTFSIFLLTTFEILCFITSTIHCYHSILLNQFDLAQSSIQNVFDLKLDCVLKISLKLHLGDI